MLDLGGIGDAFKTGILHNQVRRKIVVKRDVDVFVNRRGDKEPAKLFIVRRQIRPAATEGDS